PDEAESIATKCRAGELPCMPDKKHLAQVLSDALAAIRERRDSYAKDPDLVMDIIEDGNRRARAVAEATLDDVRRAMRLVPERERT
ncbi:MAG: tryptophan--tRNA ligase, partial [Gammaproteobacteria bacterium]|nr:tryptophan--tRNA ligase [Gammaproteobacteria bacterium]